ncbi:peroxisomal and mitochondrial division factor 2-like [Gastrolobium bilobum]|uniref:peroxisomal and mitochondrial division factor 2-like n=1 Tax=Gastrolobium bilobum TaxID=150636 RepID=UPI002AB09C54|nr:peroxisomal and mitochondrial division factor 2-like [Gastrolobium bilobum]
MAESKVANGVASAGKIEALERERDELASENAEKEKEIKKLRKEIEGLRSDGSEKKAAEVIAARAAELETELARLQHDTISDMSAAEEARAEAAELRKALDERESRVEVLEREVKGLKQVNAESEMKVRDLERKIGVLEMKETEERSKRVRVEEEMRENFDEKEREIEEFKHKIEELENVVMGKKIESEKWVIEKMNMEEKTRIMELSIVEAEKVIRIMNEKGTNGAVNGVHGEVKGLEVQWPVVAGSAGALAAVVAVIYFCFGKKR